MPNSHRNYAIPVKKCRFGLKKLCVCVCAQICCVPSILKVTILPAPMNLHLFSVRIDVFSQQLDNFCVNSAFFILFGHFLFEIGNCQCDRRIPTSVSSSQAISGIQAL